jgi:hypothetical protein
VKGPDRQSGLLETLARRVTSTAASIEFNSYTYIHWSF